MTSKNARVKFLNHLKTPCRFDIFHRALLALDRKDKETIAEERALALDTMKKLGLNMEDFGNLMDSRLRKLWDL